MLSLFSPSFFLVRTLAIALSITAISCQGRSVHRTPDPLTPTITVFSSSNPDEVQQVQSWHLLEHPFFGTFHKHYFYNHLLPSTSVTARDTTLYSGQVLNDLIEDLYGRIKRKERVYPNFTVLMDKDFNYFHACGSIVLKFKQYPFVLKLFIETPASFIHHWGKGLVQVFLHYLGGGANRHLSGFTRPLNADYIQQCIAKNPAWANRIDTPQKFYWIPKEPQWLTIESTNIGDTLHKRIDIPAVYGIVAQAIEAERVFSKCSREDVATAIALHNALDMRIDPHIDNFMIEKGTGKIVIIDTEHFPTIAGLDVQAQESGYVSWLFSLTSKCAKNMLFSTKAELHKRATTPPNSKKVLFPSDEADA
jgi:hypothetical protein